MQNRGDIKSERNLKNIALYSGAALIWWSTWLAINSQLGIVDPLISVLYRFGFASIILFIYCQLTGLNLKYKPKEHLFIALQGFSLFQSL